MLLDGERPSGDPLQANKAVILLGHQPKVTVHPLTLTKERIFSRPSSMPSALLGAHHQASGLALVHRQRSRRGGQSEGVLPHSPSS